MNTKERLESSLKEAMRSQDDLRKRTLRLTLAAIRYLEVDRGALDDAAVMAVVQKEIKSRQESLAESQRAHRPDLEAGLVAEIQVLEQFLPQPLSTEVLEDLARQAIAEVGATSPRDMGKVMKTLMPRLQGRATGAQASQVIRRLLE
jgi:uncharacterized protein